MDIKAKIDEIVEKIKSDKNLGEKFQKNPIKVIEDLIGIDLPDDQIKGIVDAVKAKINLDSIGGMLGSATDKILLLYNSRTMETADVIGTYIYRVGLIDADYGYSTAVGLFQSLVGMILLTIANTFSKKVTESSLF